MGYFDTLKNLEGIRQRENQNALARQAGGMLSQGDQTGARNALWRGGELDAGFKIEEGMASSRKTQAEAMDRWTQGVGRMLQDPRYQGNPEAAWRDALPMAERLGINADALSKDKSSFDRNPEGWVSFWNEKAKKELQFFQTDTGIYVGDKGTGDVRRAARLPGKPVVVGDYAYMPEDVEGDERGLVAPAPPPSNGMPQGSPTGRYSTPIQGGTPGFNSGVKYDRQVPAETYREAIAGIESRGSGDYSAQGPRTRTGDRAYGRYQVMGANIPQWTQEVLGRRMTPQEFLASPQAQDAVFDAKFGGYVQQYGSPEEAASVWFTGKPTVQGANRRDVNGMTGARYVQKFAQNAGSQPLQGGPQGDDLGQAPAIPGMRAVGRVKGGGGKDAPSGYRWSADGNLEAIKGGPADPNVRAMGTGSRREFASLRKEFNTLDEVKKFKATAGAYNQIRSLASKANPSPADDMALTYAFMKVNDPDSVVRESEFAMVAKTAGLPDQVVIALDKLTKGQGLTPRIRQQLVNAAATMTLQRREAYDAQARNYRAIAGDLGADADQLAEDPSKWRGRIKQPAAKPAAKAAAPAQRGPKPGTVEDGYRFKGGDPKNPKSWEKL